MLCDTVLTWGSDTRLQPNTDFAVNHGITGSLLEGQNVEDKLFVCAFTDEQGVNPYKRLF